jgi:uncharacterized protein (DUF849 family)
VIKAALNGGRARAEHPRIPITPGELATAAKESVAAGAAAIHFHVRGADGRESLDGGDVAKSLAAVRRAVPMTPVGISTGAWILENARLRHEVISRWTVLPEFASVNFKEQGAVALAEMLLDRGVAIEVGLSDKSGTQAFIASGLAARCLRLLVEPFEASTQVALDTVEEIEAMLEDARVKLPCVLHGLNQTAWDLIDVAAARGFDTRVGFEDILTLPDGTMAGGNGDLVAETVRRMQRAAAR